MVGILQMFSLALLTNFGSAARTDLLYKAQQVVENLRLIYFLQRRNRTRRLARTRGRPGCRLRPPTTPIYLPYFSGDSGSGIDGDTSAAQKWAYWGPTGFNVVEAETPSLPALLHRRGRATSSFWLVTVTATPVDNPNLPPSSEPSPGRRPTPTTPAAFSVSGAS